MHTIHDGLTARSPPVGLRSCTAEYWYDETGSKTGNGKDNEPRTSTKGKGNGPFKRGRRKDKRKGGAIVSPGERATGNTCYQCGAEVSTGGGKAATSTTDAKQGKEPRWEPSPYIEWFSAKEVNVDGFAALSSPTANP